MSEGSTPDLFQVAVIGAGYFAQFHHDAWQRMANAELAGVADRDSDRAPPDGTPFFTDAGEMLNAVNPDIIDIATPPDTHLGFIELALAHRPKAIICQKPFCGDRQNAQKAVSMAEDAGTPLIVHENFRFQPWYRKVKDLLAEGRIGDVHQITFRLRPGDGQGPRAYMDRQPYFQQMPKFLIHETGVHWIDTFRYLLGEPSAVFADLRQLNPAISGEDAGFFLLEYDGGRRAMFDGNRLLDHPAENHRLTMGECHVEGTQGELRLLGDGTLTLRMKGERHAEQVFAPDQPDRFGGDCVFALQSAVVTALQGRAPFENLAEDYIKVMEVEERIYESAETGRKVPC